MIRSLALAISILVIGISCGDRKEKLFRPLDPDQTGIHFANSLNDSPDLNILNYLYYYNGGGVVAADFNNDDLVDLYFVGNQVADELYINKGDLSFERATDRSGIDNATGWSTGATHVDINNDGLLDIYICKVGRYRSIKGKNLLYVNKGIDENGFPLFEEQAAQYGLDFIGFSTQAAFFDYDLDDDLDMFLMNHSVHPNRTYGRGSIRKRFDPLSGDVLFRNDGGKFIEVSEEAGIFQGKIGYGLGLSISDVNNDGYPDIYVGNDFFENDYLYINQQDGTFKDLISADNLRLGHTTHYSMGNDIADINNDGLMDIVSLDMLPEDLKTYKTSGLEYAYPIYQQYLRNGYAPQYMQNTLHLNLGNGNFSEIAHISGIAATEWSWGALLADFDNDGLKDIFITNGIKGATNDMDYMNFIANEDLQRRIDAGMDHTDMPLIHEIPEKKVPNYFFKNNGDLTFTNTTEIWSEARASFSNGTTYADLDNDGDLDIIVSNINEKALILKNNAQNNNFLQITFDGATKNKFGIGAKAIAFVGNKVYSAENFVVRGYLSSSPSKLHLGLGKDSIIDSLTVVWPGGAFETLQNVRANQLLEVSQKNATGNYYEKRMASPVLYTMNDTLVAFVHKDPISLDFDREPLIPYAGSNKGPALAVADINNDGLHDLFLGGAKKQSSALYVQNASGGFSNWQPELFEAHATNEDVASTFIDVNGDGFKDLLVGSGGNEFKKGLPLQPRLYLNDNGKFALDPNQFAKIAANVSKIAPLDFDQDGDIDFFMASDQISTQFGKTPKQYFFENDGTGKFKNVVKRIAPDLERAGNITDAVWIDLDGNGYDDLIVVGHWMPISIFLNDGQALKPYMAKGLDKTHGWWNTVKVDDFDNDGDFDIVAGNWGLNSKFSASLDKPIKLYNNDFDENGTLDPIVTYYHQDIETPFASKDELVKQLPDLNKKFLLYQDFADATMQDLFGKEKLRAAEKKYVYELASCYFENQGNGQFVKRPLPLAAQFSVVNDMVVDDFNSDGYKDLLIVGNNFEISTQLGRLDALHGLFLQNDQNGGFMERFDTTVDISGAAKTVEKVTINGQKSYIVGRNNDSPIFLIKKEKE